MLGCATAYGALGASGLLSACGTIGSPSRNEKVLERSENVVLRGGHVVTMDRAIGDLYRGDVHIRDGVIVGVGHELEAPGADIFDATDMVVMPGFVDTHWHMWNTLLKNMVQPRKGFGYFELKTALGPQHTPEDFYRANRLALTEAIDSGVTSVVNYAHNTMSPAHVDAEIRAMVESGLRGRYAYGGADPTPTERTVDLEDLERVQQKWFRARGQHTQRIDLAFATRSPGGLPKVYRKEFEKAKDLGIPLILHTGTSPNGYVSAAKLYAEGFLDRSTIAVHSILFDQQDRDAMVRAGASNSFSAPIEMRYQRGGDLRQQLMLMKRDGINFSLSFDTSTQNATSMFEQMRFAWSIGAPVFGTPTEKVPAITTTECIEMATINGARALGLGDVTGSLTPGKRADIIMLRSAALNIVPLGDLHNAIVRSARDVNVDTVIADGRILKRGGRVVSVDVQQVSREATEALYNIRRRAGGQYAPQE